MRANTPDFRGISIVCVYNDPAVREECLDRSIALHSGSVDVEYIAIDNTQHEFTSAGAALNHGAGRARHDVVVFVHQDVHLHSIERIAEVARHLDGDRWGILGASGVPSRGAFVGRMRDRVQVIGDNADAPLTVDSLDEVLFMIRRDRVLAEPLSTDPDLAWHAYAVEYGVRMRRLGLGVGAVNLPVTHNSLTINLDRLDVAHRRVAALYPEALPCRTTCGDIGPRATTWKDTPFVRAHGWRLGWAVRSFRALRGGRVLHIPAVFADIRLDVDLLAFEESGGLTVVNFDRLGGFAEFAGDPVRLTRRGNAVAFRAASSLDEVLAMADAASGEGSVLIADLEMSDLPHLAGRLTGPYAVGARPPAGTTWLLGGAVLDEPGGVARHSGAAAAPGGAPWPGEPPAHEGPAEPGPTRTRAARRRSWPTPRWSRSRPR